MCAMNLRRVHATFVGPAYPMRKCPHEFLDLIVSQRVRHVSLVRILHCGGCESGTSTGEVATGTRVVHLCITRRSFRMDHLGPAARPRDHNFVVSRDSLGADRRERFTVPIGCRSARSSADGVAVDAGTCCYAEQGCAASSPLMQVAEVSLFAEPRAVRRVYDPVADRKIPDGEGLEEEPEARNRGVLSVLGPTPSRRHQSSPSDIAERKGNWGREPEWLPPTCSR